MTKNKPKTNQTVEIVYNPDGSEDHYGIIKEINPGGPFLIVLVSGEFKGSTIAVDKFNSSPGIGANLI